MKIVFDRVPFLAAFVTAANFAPSNSAKDILTTVKLDTTAERVTLAGTDLEIGCQVTVEGVEIDSPGQAALPRDSFAAILKASEDDRLLLKTTAKGGIEISGERCQYKLPLADASDFPAIAEFDATAFHTVPACDLRDALRRTVFATDEESARYALGSVRIELGVNTLRAVATDGRRLATTEITATETGSVAATALIPTRAVKALLKSLPDNDDAVDIAFRSNDAIFRTPTATTYCRQTEGRFPRWQDVIPARRDCPKIELKVELLLDAVRQASLVLDQETRGVNLDFDFDGQQITLSGQSPGRGQSKVNLPIGLESNHPAIVTSLDHRFLIECLRILPAEGIVTLDIEDGDRAVLLTLDRFCYVVMPLSRDR